MDLQQKATPITFTDSFEFFHNNMFKLFFQVNFVRIIYKQKLPSPLTISFDQYQNGQQISKSTSQLPAGQNVIQLHKMKPLKIYMEGNEERVTHSDFSVYFITYTFPSIKRKLPITLNKIKSHFMINKADSDNHPLDLVFTFQQGEIYYKITAFQDLSNNIQQRPFDQILNSISHKTIQSSITHTYSEMQQALNQESFNEAALESNPISKITQSTIFRYQPEYSKYFEQQGLKIQDKFQSDTKVKKMKLQRIYSHFQTEKNLDRSFNNKIKFIIILLLLGIGFLIFDFKSGSQKIVKKIRKPKTLKIEKAMNQNKRKTKLKK